MAVRPQHERQHGLGVLAIEPPEIAAKLGHGRLFIAPAHPENDRQQVFLNLCRVERRPILWRDAGTRLRGEPRMHQNCDGSMALRGPIARRPRGHQDRWQPSRRSCRASPSTFTGSTMPGSSAETSWRGGGARNREAALCFPAFVLATCFSALARRNFSKSPTR
jgi:hypothetical protein